MNIAVLGGRFDPPHIWHFWTCQQVLENIKGIDQVWYMPDKANAFRPIATSYDERAEMLRFMETGRLRLSTMAFMGPSVTYTIDIVRELNKNTSNKYFWMVGSDIMSEVNRWREYQKLSKIIQFLVFPRKDYPIKSMPAGFQRVPGHLLLSNVSSSLIRERVKADLPIKGLVFPEIEKYIKERKLYK